MGAGGVRAEASKKKSGKQPDPTKLGSAALREKGGTKTSATAPATAKLVPTKAPVKAPVPAKAPVKAEALLRSTGRDITGNDVKLLRSTRLRWTTRDFAAFFDVAVSAVGRWEACGERSVTADRHFYNLMLVLVDVLDRVPNAAEKLGTVVNAGPHRGLHMLFGLYFGDAPWVDTQRSVIGSNVHIIGG